MKLAILICTLPEEYSINLLKRLTNILNPQLVPGVDLYIHDAGRVMPTGTKRNELIKNTDSDYFCFIDSDDIVPIYYVNEMMKAIDQGPDVVTFIGEMTTDHRDRRGFTIKLGNKYEERNGHYYRFPNHLCAYRREVVESVKFPDIWIQEDFKWASNIQRFLKTEVHIEKNMYTYDFITYKPKK